MRRREFIGLVAGAAATWPLSAIAQKAARVPLIGVLMGLRETDPVTISYVQELRRALRDVGWSDGQNIGFTYR
jgi:putative ABC transport system substrate-binding protein